MRKIQLPFTRKESQECKAGELVLLSGVVYTARDAAHARLKTMIENNEPLPFPLENATIYYVGPSPTPKGKVIGAAGPTTSSRMDAFTPMLCEKGVQGFIGKGKRSCVVKEALQKSHSIYFVACGGAGAYLSACILENVPVAFEDLGSEAIHRLTLKDFPCWIGIDGEGRDLYDLG